MPADPSGYVPAPLLVSFSTSDLRSSTTFVSDSYVRYQAGPVLVTFHRPDFYFTSSMYYITYVLSIAIL
jgi:hypothetical protein